MSNKKKIILFANTDWYLYHFRLALAKHLHERGADVLLVSPHGPYGKIIETEGFRWIPISMDRRSLNPLREILVLWRLYRIYKTEKPDVVHHFTIKCVIYGGLVASAAQVHGVISAVTGLGYVFIRNDILARALRPLVRRLLKFILDGSNRYLILQNPDDKQVFLKAGIVDYDRIIMIAGSGVDTKRFQISPHQNRVSRAYAKVVFAARLLWDKGLSEFVEAAKIIECNGINAKFIIAGEPDPGNPSSVPGETLAKWKLLPNIVFIGHIADMPGLLEDTDIMVLPSYREGLPRSLIEAAATGIPIVTTDVPGCREVVDTGLNGFLVPMKDSISLANAIMKILEDPVLASRMGVAGRIKALSEFDERLVFEKTVDVYRKLGVNI